VATDLLALGVLAGAFVVVLVVMRLVGPEATECGEQEAEDWMELDDRHG
jgi:hypothetical protein